MNRLRGMRFYLAGPIDSCPNGGRHWRERITPFLRSMGAVVIDPTNKTIELASETPDSLLVRKQLREQERWDELREYMDEIYSYDLRAVDTCDALIANVDFDIRMWGTLDEISVANRQKKPVIVRCAQGKAQMPDWSFRQLRHEIFFDDWDQVNSYLIKVDLNDTVDSLNRWKFLNL